MQFLPFQPLSLEKGRMEVERPISPAGTQREEEMGNRRGGRERCDPCFSCSSVGGSKERGDQQQYRLIADGFARINSDKQADSSWRRSKADHMLKWVSFS